MRLPVVSVVLPTFNRCRWLAQTVASVFAQTFQDFELIVVDDASTDHTCEVIEHCRDSRLVYVRHETNMGVAAARNTGLGLARGELIAFQDDDVEWFPEKLATVVEAFQNLPPSVGVVYSGAWVVERGLRTYEIFPDHKPETDLYSLLLESGAPGTPRLVVRRACLEHVGLFDGRLRRYEDWDLCIRIAKDYSFFKIDQPLQTIYYPDVGLSNNAIEHLRCASLIVSKYQQEYLRLGKRKYLSGRLVELGHLACQLGWSGQGRRWLLNAVSLEPTNRRALVGLALSLCGGHVYRGAVRLRDWFRRRGAS